MPSLPGVSSALAPGSLLQEVFHALIPAGGLRYFWALEFSASFPLSHPLSTLCEPHLLKDREYIWFVSVSPTQSLTQNSCLEKVGFE